MILEASLIAGSILGIIILIKHLKNKSIQINRLKVQKPIPKCEYNLLLRTKLENGREVGKMFYSVGLSSNHAGCKKNAHFDSEEKLYDYLRRVKNGTE